MNQNELPDEYPIEDIFFGDDDRLDMDFSKGRPPKTEDDKKKPREQTKKIKAASGSKHSAIQKKLEEQEDLIKQAKFLRKFEERIQRLEEQEKKQKEVAAVRKQQKKQVKKKLKKHSLKPIQAIRGELKELVSCNHEDVFDFFDGQNVRSKCKHCSREKIWSPQDWRKANPFVPSIMNPNPVLFPF